MQSETYFNPLALCQLPFVRKLSKRVCHLVAAGGLMLLASQVQAQAPSLFATVSQGTGSPETQAVTVTVQAAGTLSSISVVTKGGANLDFTDAGAGSCTVGQSYAAGSSCTVNVQFQPKDPGGHYGAVVLSFGGSTTSTQFVYGASTGPVGTIFPGLIRTVAGTNNFLYDKDGVKATIAPIYLPLGEALDDAGNLYLSDSGNHRIRKVDTNGYISTYVGNGQPGFTGDGGLATVASITSPSALVLDGAGNLYFADSGSNVIRRVDAVTHIITTVAGVGSTAGYNGDKPVSLALLTQPNGLALDTAQNLYIADTGNNLIRKLDLKVDPSLRVVQTIAGVITPGFGGDGQIAASAIFNTPWGIAIGIDGNLYIADVNNNVIRRIDPTGSGTTATVAGTPTNTGSFSGDGSLATSAMLQNPQGVTIDLAGNLYIADTQNNRIRKVNASTGIITTISGGNSQSFAGDGGNSDLATMSAPSSITLDRSGNIYFSDMFHNRVRAISNNLAQLSYGQIKNFRTSAPKPEVFENDGNDVLTLKPFTFDNASLDPATSTCPSTATLNPGASCTLGVVFAPTVANLPQGGAMTNGSVTVASDAANTPGVIGLTGDVLTVNPSTVTVSSSLSPSALNAPVNFTATVTNGGNGTLTGTVNFLDGSTTIGSGTLNASGVATFSTSSLTLGQHSITVAYSGDTNNAPSTSTPAIIQVIKSGTSVALQSNANPSVFPANVTFTATLTGATSPVTGAITFSDGTTALGSVIPNGSGIATLSTSTLTPGPHSIVAAFSGDANNLGSTVTLTQTVSQSQTTTTLSSSNPSVTFGDAVTLQALVVSSSAPTLGGTVTFRDGANIIGTGTLDANGAASLSISTLTPGVHSITAAYGGDTDNAASTSSPYAETIQQIATTSVVISDADPSNAGAAVNLTVTVSANGGTTVGGPLTGSATFYDGAAVLGTKPLSSTGAATLNIATLSVGTHTITAIYTGNTNYGQSTSAAWAQTVRQAATTTALSSSALTSIAGKAITLVAVVSGAGATPSGTVSFSDGANVLGQATLDARGQASLVVSSLTVGSHSISATYGGNTNNASSVSAPLTQTVNIAATYLTLSSSSNPSQAGVAVTLSASLTGEGAQPSGSITFRDGSVPIGTAAVNGTSPVTITISSLSVGTHTITAVYSGDSNDASSVSPSIAQVVQQVATTTTLISNQNPATLGQPITLTASVSSIGLVPGGTITFEDGAANIGVVTLNAGGTAVLTTSSLALGTHSIVAIYSGDANHVAGQSTALSQHVLQSTALSIGSSINPSIAKTNVVFTAKLSSVQNLMPSGSVSFKDGATVIGTGVVDGAGVATLSTASLAVGQHTITASYGGDTNYKPIDSSAIVQTVVIADTNVALATSSNPATSGAPLTFTATVTGTGGTASGTVAFEDGTTILGKVSLNGAGIATFTTAVLAPGIHTISALYSGDSNNQPNTSASLKQQVQQATRTSVASSSNPALTLAPIVLTSTVANGGTQPASGTVTFTDGGQVLGSSALDANGVATLSLTSLSAGVHSIMAAYGGDVSDFSSASTPLSQTVQFRPTTDALTATATSLTGGSQLTLISVVRWDGPVVPTGTVDFKIGSVTIGTRPVDKAGVATMTVVLDPGSATVVASYSGDAVYAASSSPSTAVSNGPATNFAMHLSSSDLTLASKQHMTVDLTLTSIKGFSDDLALGCIGLPFAATCTFSTVQPSLPSDGAQTVHIVVDTGSPLLAGTVAENRSPAASSTAALCFLPFGTVLGWALFGSRKRHPLTGLLLVLATIGLAVGMTGCGTLDLKGTPAGTYSFKVTASGLKTGVTQSTDVTLTVTQ